MDGSSSDGTNDPKEGATSIADLYEDATIDCFDDQGNYGLAAPVSRSRCIHSRMSEMKRLRFSYEQGGTWYMWPSMGGNVIWDVSDWVTDVTEVRITSTLNSDSCGTDWEAAFPGGGCLPDPSPFHVDDFSISP